MCTPCELCAGDHSLVYIYIFCPYFGFALINYVFRRTSRLMKTENRYSPQIRQEKIPFGIKLSWSKNLLHGQMQSVHLGILHPQRMFLLIYIWVCSVWPLLLPHYSFDDNMLIFCSYRWIYQETFDENVIHLLVSYYSLHVHCIFHGTVKCKHRCLYSYVGMNKIM